MYSRSGVLNGEDIDLRVIFTDSLSNLVATDALPTVYLFDDTLTDEELALALEAEDYSGAVAGPFAATMIVPGYYQYVYTVPDSATDQIWRDVWIGMVNTVVTVKTFYFTTVEGPDLTYQSLGTNQLVLIELEASISSYDETKTLGSDIQLSFSTVYTPYYASTDLVRLEGGAWLDFIPDDTLSLMIHWSSLEANYITTPGCKGPQFNFARQKFVAMDTILKCLTLPGGSDVVRGGGYPNAGKRKMLGDLMIDNSAGANSQTTASGLDIETLRYFRTQRDEWWRVVNAGGMIVPGQGLSPTFAVKGEFDPDRRNSGRLWANPEYTRYAQAAANTKYVPDGARRAKFGFDESSRYSPLEIIRRR